MTRHLVWHSGPNCLLESHSKVWFWQNTIQICFSLSLHPYLLPFPYPTPPNCAVFLFWKLHVVARLWESALQTLSLLNSRFAIYSIRKGNLWHCTFSTLPLLALPWHICTWCIPGIHFPYALGLQTWYPFLQKYYSFLFSSLIHLLPSHWFYKWVCIFCVCVIYVQMFNFSSSKVCI